MAKRTNAKRLDREIAQALSRRHYATIHEAPPSAEASWDVAMDALLEHDTERAAGIVRSLDVSTMTPAFDNALDKVPSSVRKAFENAASVVGKKSYDWKAFGEGAATAYWSDGYASEVDNLEDDETRRALSPSPGGRWEDVLPDLPPAAKALGKKFAKQVREKLTTAQLNAVASQFSPDEAGYYGAMQSVGHGIGWFDKGVKVDPPKNYGLYDVKLNDSIWRALKKAARFEGVTL